MDGRAGANLERLLEAPLLEVVPEHGRVLAGVRRLEQGVQEVHSRGLYGTH